MGGDPELHTGGKITNENAEKSVITEVVLAVVAAQKGQEWNGQSPLTLISKPLLGS